MGRYEKDIYSYEKIADIYKSSNYVTLPILLLPYILLLTLSNLAASDISPLFWTIDFSITTQPQQLTILLFYLSVTSCLIIIISTAVKDVKKYRMMPIYSLLSFLGAGFIVISYITNVIGLFSKRSILWRGRRSHISQSNKVQSSR
jgi:hypothetical protein